MKSFISLEEAIEILNNNVNNLDIEEVDLIDGLNRVISENIYAQIIDDINAVTIVSASSLEKDFSAKGGNKEGAKLVGELVAKKALEKGIKDVVFDRGGYVYHGRVQQLAEAAREAGLNF